MLRYRALIQLLLIMLACSGAPNALAQPLHTESERQTALPADLQSDLRWYLHGVNYPWLNYGEDFGDPRKGVAANYDVHDAKFADMAARGVRVVRWWAFPDARIVHNPGLLPQAYADLDAAVELANRHDLYLHFTLLNMKPDEADFAADPAGARRLLDDAFVPIFQRYGREPRILSWDAMNEWDEPVEKGRWRLDGLRRYIRAVAEAVHANTDQKVTASLQVGGKNRDWVRNLGLDFYVFHRYDWLGPLPAYDPLAHSAGEWGMDRPIVIGELQDRGSAVPERYEQAYALGYSGAWPWSYNFQSTQDRMQVDWDFFSDFSLRRAGEWRLH